MAISRKILRTLSLLVLTFSLASAAHADWPAKALQLTRTYSHPFKGGYDATLWRAANVPWLVTRDFPNYREVMIGKLPAGILFQQKSEKTKRAPLMIVLPGIFAHHKSPAALREAQRYLALGYHVLLLPNPWSSKWIAYHREGIPPGTLRSEYQILNEMIGQFVTENRPLLTSVNLTGSSYGAFLGAMVAAQSQWIDGKITLFGPPFDFKRTLDKIDRIADATFDLVLPITMLEWKIAAFLDKNTPADLINWKVKMGPPLAVYAGFIEGARNAALTYTYVQNREDYEPAGLNSDDRRKWIRSFRFRDYVKEFLPDFDEIVTTQESRFDYWLGRALARGADVRVLTADNDFINERGDWGPIGASPRLIVLSHGGHLGFMGIPWFDRFLSAAQ